MLASVITEFACQGARSSANARRAVAQQLNSACREAGFFYVTNHGDGLASASLRSTPRCKTPQGCDAPARLKSSIGSGAQEGNLTVYSPAPPLVPCSRG